MGVTASTMGQPTIPHILAALQLAFIAAASAQPLAAVPAPPSPLLSVSAVVAVEAAQQAAAAEDQRVQQVTAEAFTAQSAGLAQTEAFSRNITATKVHCSDAPIRV